MVDDRRLIDDDMIQLRALANIGSRQDDAVFNDRAALDNDVSPDDAVFNISIRMGPLATNSRGFSPPACIATAQNR